MGILRWTSGLVVFLALLFLALQNSESVTVRLYHWFTWQAPLIFLLLIAFVAGVAAGLLTGIVRTHRLRRQITRLRREHAKQRGKNPSAPVDGA